MRVMAGLAGNSDTVSLLQTSRTDTHAHRVDHRWIVVAGFGRIGHIPATAAHGALCAIGGRMLFARIHADAWLAGADAVCRKGDRRL